MGNTLVPDDRACGSCGKRPERVFQGAVGAFWASTAPAASTGVFRFWRRARGKGTQYASSFLRMMIQQRLRPQVVSPIEPFIEAG